MKIYTKKIPLLIKVNIYHNNDSESKRILTLSDTTFEKVVDFISVQINSYGSAIKRGKSVTVRIKEYINGKVTTGKDKCMTFYGMTSHEFESILLDVIESGSYLR